MHAVVEIQAEQKKCNEKHVGFRRGREGRGCMVELELGSPRRTLFRKHKQKALGTLASWREGTSQRAEPHTVFVANPEM